MLVTRKPNEKADEYRAIVRAIHVGNVARIRTRNKPLEIRNIISASITENKPVIIRGYDGGIDVRKATKRNATTLANMREIPNVNW